MEAFGELAKRFCAVVESAPALSQRTLIARLSVTLADLYAAALRLPDVDDSGDAIYQPMSDDEWQTLYRSLTRSFGRFDRYNAVFSPYAETDSLEASLADDIADVYRDVSNGLRLADMGAEPPAVIAEWRDSFYLHWGHHALSALRCLHAAIMHEDLE